MSWLSLGPLIVTGEPGTLFFWWAQMVRGAPTALTCFVVNFPTDFVTSVRASVVSAGVLAFGSRKTQGGGAHPLQPPWLRPWLRLQRSPNSNMLFLIEMVLRD